VTKPLMDAARRRFQLKRGEHVDPPPSGLANAAGSPGQQMVAASASCQVSPTRYQARTRLYRDGRLELEGFPVAGIGEYLADESVTISPGDLGGGTGRTCVTPTTTTSPC